MKKAFTKAAIAALLIASPLAAHSEEISIQSPASASFMMAKGKNITSSRPFLVTASDAFNCMTYPDMACTPKAAKFVNLLSECPNFEDTIKQRNIETPDAMFPATCAAPKLAGLVK